MSLQEFLRQIDKIVKSNPEVLKMKVVYAIDEEGNAFYEVPYVPTIGRYENNEFDDSGSEPNAICIN